MVTMICEMCGCRDVVKRDGLYVCAECGTKYSPDDARKLIWHLDDAESADGLSSCPPSMQYDQSASYAAPSSTRASGVVHGASAFAGLFLVLIANAILATAVLCLASQKVPSAIGGNIGDLLFVLSGIAAIATLVSSVADLGGGPSRRTALCAAACSALTAILAVVNIADGLLFPVIYLAFSLVNGLAAWSRRERA